MLEELGPLLKNLPPKTAAALVQAINRCGRELGIGPEWVRRWIAFTVVADALTHYSPDGEPMFELKGGAAIEMRLRRLVREEARAGEVQGTELRPRATRDLDATFRGTLDEIEAAVRAALAEPRHRFAFRVAMEATNAPMMRQMTIHVAYREERFGRLQERAFSNVRLEISTYEGIHREPEMVPAFSLKPFGLEGPEELPCLPLTKQVAQKFHAATERPEDGRANDRFRDLLDIVILSGLTPPSRELREVCEETFQIRGQQTWPPEVVAHPHWVQPMEQRAREMGLPQESAEEIVQHVLKYLRAIAAAE